MWEVDSAAALQRGQRIVGMSIPLIERLKRVGILSRQTLQARMFTLIGMILIHLVGTPAEGKRVSSITLRADLTENKPEPSKFQVQRSFESGRTTSLMRWLNM
ncbi:hypothetical protein Tco_0290842, partial [Tanacetum coccineum]